MTLDRVIGVDLGGTKILAGLVARDGAIGRTVEVPTPEGTEAAVLDALDALVEQFVEDAPLAIGLGVPLNLDRKTGIGYRATNLPLRNVDLAGRIREQTGLPTGIENDGNAAALAEWQLGAGRGVDDLVALTLGTGVGGGIVLGGSLYRGWAELGHIVVDADGPPCPGHCHGRGHLEAVASGHAADRAAVELYGKGSDSYMLVERARAGDEPALAALERIGHFVGIAIGSLANVFAPDLFVIGGGFGAATEDLLLPSIERTARREAIEPADTTLRVMPAQLGEEAGLVGAALVGFAALDGAR
ncbi:MAG: ROK family protein [Gaiella sp.]